MLLSKYMGTLTLSVDDEIETYFRKIVNDRYGQSKGVIGKAASEAFLNWAQDHDQAKIAERALRRMHTGQDMGKRLFRSRDELHDR